MPSKVLISTCGAHLIQDGLVALQYVLLPVLAQLFGLSYAQVGLVRAISNTAMSLIEVPAGILAEKTGERRLLAMGLVGAGAGYAGVAVSDGFIGIAVCFFIAGTGAAFQHSLSSSSLVRTFEGGARRKALGTYNSFGDVGKLTFTGLFSAATGAGMAWGGVVFFLASTSILFGLAVLWLMRGRRFDNDDKTAVPEEQQEPKDTPAGWGIKEPRRFWGLGAIVFLDSTVQAVFLTFLVFLLTAKGVSTSVASFGVVIALTGGMIGKFACGYLAARVGDRNAFVVIQLLSIIAIAALVYLPANTVLLLLPFIGLVIQGSSTVTYGSVADYIDDGRQSRGYALIYSLANASSVTGPLVFGMIADAAGLTLSVSCLAVLLAITLVLAFTTIRSAGNALAT